MSAVQPAGQPERDTQRAAKAAHRAAQRARTSFLAMQANYLRAAPWDRRSALALLQQAASEWALAVTGQALAEVARTEAGYGQQ